MAWPCPDCCKPTNGNEGYEGQTPSDLCPKCAKNRIQIKGKSFMIDLMTGTLKKDRKPKKFEQALNKFLKTWCGSVWEYRWPDDGLFEPEGGG